MKLITLVRIATVLFASGMIMGSWIFLKYFIYGVLFKQGEYDYAYPLFILTLLAILVCTALVITVFKDKN